MYYSFDDFLFEKLFISWIENSSNPRNRRYLCKPYSFPYKTETIQYKRTAGPFLTETSHKSEDLGYDYFGGRLSQLASENRLKQFVTKYGISTFEYKQSVVDGGAPPNQSPENIRKMIRRLSGYDKRKTVTLQIIRYRVLDINQQKIDNIRNIFTQNETKNLLRLGSNFYQHFSGTPLIESIISKGLGAKPGIVYPYSVFLNRIEYFTHSGQENAHIIWYKDLGYRDMQSITDCCGLGFAIAECFLKNYELSLENATENGTVIARINSDSSLYVNFNITGKIERIPQLRPWLN